MLEIFIHSIFFGLLLFITREKEREKSIATTKNVFQMNKIYKIIKHSSIPKIDFKQLAVRNAWVLELEIPVFKSCITFYR